MAKNSPSNRPGNRPNKVSGPKRAAVSAPSSRPEVNEDVKLLHSMGYAQELSRRMSGFSNFAVSFSIICILSGGINSLGQGISSIGGAAIGIGWPIGALISLVFALGMAQIASAYPTAGGLYHWGSILGGKGWGWATAWLNLIGLVTVLAAIAFSFIPGISLDVYATTCALTFATTAAKTSISASEAPSDLPTATSKRGCSRREACCTAKACPSPGLLLMPWTANACKTIF